MKTVTYDPRTHRLIRRDKVRQFLELVKIYKDANRWVSCCMGAVANQVDKRSLIARQRK